ncbi:hypothetical protein Trydic_g2689 [Trypoxylus dichotomus]
MNIIVSVEKSNTESAGFWWFQGETVVLHIHQSRRNIGNSASHPIHFAESKKKHQYNQIERLLSHAPEDISDVLCHINDCRIDSIYNLCFPMEMDGAYIFVSDCVNY